jgi:transcriptional regulator with XRE-family HTH domain
MTSLSVVSTSTRHLRDLLRVAIGQEEIGRRIAQARNEAGLNQRQLAELIGVADAQSISRYERGKTALSTKRLRKIAEATGKPMNYFVLEPLGEQMAQGDQERLSSLLGRLEQLVTRLEAAQAEPQDG